MSKRTVLTTHDYLIGAELPPATETYTVIPHGQVIEHTKSMLSKKNFEIVRELYRCNQDARVAQGIYHLKYGDDQDMGLLFAWSNSYDKSMKFKCSIGGYVHESLASIIPGNMGTWGRKHTGTADDECFETISDQINNAETFFAQLVADKETMKTLFVSERIRAELLGRLYLIEDVFTTEQLSMIKQQFIKPAHTYSGIKDSLWAMYNNIIFSLQKAHPRTWMDQQKLVHWFLCKEFNIGLYANPNPVQVTQNSVETVKKEEVDPRQYDLETMIAEVEQEQANKEVEAIFDQPQEYVINSQEVVEKYTEASTEDDLPWSYPDTDDSWVCLSCNEVQGPESVFFDGQLCGKCVNSK